MPSISTRVLRAWMTALLSKLRRLETFDDEEERLIEKLSKVQQVFEEDFTFDESSHWNESSRRITFERVGQF